MSQDSSTKFRQKIVRARDDQWKKALEDIVVSHAGKTPQEAIKEVIEQMSLTALT